MKYKCPQCNKPMPKTCYCKYCRAYMPLPEIIQQRADAIPKQDSHLNAHLRQAPVETQVVHVDELHDPDPMERWL